MEQWTLSVTLLVIVVGATAYWSPRLCRMIAAVLLTHADTVEEARDFRRRRWAQHGAALGVLRVEEVDCE